jgi:hypothetical protein
VAERPTLFVDRSLGKGVGRKLREAGATVELHDEHFQQCELDKVWIPEVTKRGWVILTKDKNIRRACGEREYVLLAKARLFTLSSGSMSGALMAETFVNNLAEIERIAATQTPPFSYIVSPGGLQQIALVHPPKASADEQPPDDEDTSKSS